MKRKITALASATAALCLGLVCMAGCAANQQEENQAESTEVEEETPFTLIVGFDNGYPPYGFIGDDGEYTGFDIDLAKAVAERNGWEIQLEAIDWDSKDALLGQGTINCIWNGFTMEGREDEYTFSDPYMLNQQVVVVKADSGISGDADLAGKNVMTQADSAALEVLEGDMADLTDTFASLQTIGDYNNAFMQLEMGAVDAVACDLSIAQYQMAANPDKYVMLEPALSSEHYAVGLALGQEELAAQITNTLLDLYNDGTIAQLCEKYGEYGVSIENWVLTPESVA